MKCRNGDLAEVNGLNSPDTHRTIKVGTFLIRDVYLAALQRCRCGGRAVQLCWDYKDAAAGILAPFVSFSIEFSSFPDFADTSRSRLATREFGLMRLFFTGNKSKPNKFPISYWTSWPSFRM